MNEINLLRLSLFVGIVSLCLLFVLLHLDINGSSDSFVQDSVPISMSGVVTKSFLSDDAIFLEVSKTDTKKVVILRSSKDELIHVGQNVKLVLRKYEGYADDVYVSVDYDLLD